MSWFRRRCSSTRCSSGLLSTPKPLGIKSRKIRAKALIFWGITTAGPEALELFLDLNRKMGDLFHRPALIHKSIHKALRVPLGAPYWWDGALDYWPGVGISLLTVYGTCGSFANPVVLRCYIFLGQIWKWDLPLASAGTGFIYVSGISKQH